MTSIIITDAKVAIFVGIKNNNLYLCKVLSIEQQILSMNQQYPSILLEKAVGEFSKLPGIGRKTAMRLVLHLLRQDTAAVEATQQYRGLYHVLGGVISPMDGVGPSDLQIESLVQRVAEGGIKEVILALSTTMEGDTTNFYIYRKLDKLGVKLSVIARGISVGDELEYADEVTLGRSIVNRTLFTGTV